MPDNRKYKVRTYGNGTLESKRNPISRMGTEL